MQRFFINKLTNNKFEYISEMMTINLSMRYMDVRIINHVGEIGSFKIWQNLNARRLFQRTESVTIGAMTALPTDNQCRICFVNKDGGRRIV